MKGILYGVGIGPGDPELLTLKAVRILKEADVIALPDAGGEKTALSIAAEYIEGKPQLLCNMPMTRDSELLEKSHRESAEKIMELLEKGQTVAFITLGDPSVYSTYMYLHRIVLSKEYPAKIIPGITSFCAAAAALNVSLCDGGQALHVIPASYPDAEKLLALDGSKVLMKSGKSLRKVKDTLKEAGIYEKAQMAECCSMPGEKTYRSLDDAPDDASYFSIILIKDEA